MSQFGWQFETQIVSTNSENQALMEFVVLVGGVEQDALNLSLVWLAGYRLPGGLEFGVGPSVSMNKDSDDVTTSMIVAVGRPCRSGSCTCRRTSRSRSAKGGPRVTTLLGWIVG